MLMYGAMETTKILIDTQLFFFQETFVIYLLLTTRKYSTFKTTLNLFWILKSTIIRTQKLSSSALKNVSTTF